MCMPVKGNRAGRRKQGMFKGSRVGEAGVCTQWGMGWGALWAKRGPGGAGGMCTSFITVADKGADGMVEMRGWERKGRYPLVSKGESKATEEQGWGSRSGC